MAHGAELAGVGQDLLIANLPRLALPERLVLADQVPPPAGLAADPRVESRVGKLLDLAPGFAQDGYDGVFHLASAVSGECEADFELGLRSNLDSTRALLDALRKLNQARHAVGALCGPWAALSQSHLLQKRRQLAQQIARKKKEVCGLMSSSA